MRGFYELSIALHRASWPGDKLGPMVISVPHRGHRQTCFSGIVESVSVFDRSAATQCRAIDSRLARCVLERNPKCRMRTKARGRMC